MTYTEISSLNMSEELIDGTLCYISNITPIFFIMFLFAFFMIILFTSIAVGIRRQNLNFMAVFTVSSFLTFIMSVILSINPCIRNEYAMIFLGILTLISFALLWFQKEKY